jgi:hypothetical protein
VKSRILRKLCYQVKAIAKHPPYPTVFVHQELHRR